MKVAFIIPNLKITGPNIYTLNLIDSLKKNDQDMIIDVFYFRSSQTYKVDFNNINKLNLINFSSIIKFKNYDIIHTYGFKPDLLLFFLSFFFNVKWLITIHNICKNDLDHLYGKFFSRVISFVWYFAFNRCKNLVVFSSYMKNYYQSELKECEIIVIPTGVPISKKNEISNSDYKLLTELKGKYTILGSSGLLINRKGYHQILNFLQHNRKFCFIIIGDGEKREFLTDLSQQLNVSDRFKILGFKENPKDYYPYFDIFVLPSYSEGLPLSLIEAMESHLPIVCSDLKNYDDYFKKNSAFLFTPDNTKSLTDAIISVSQNIDYYRNESYLLFDKYFNINIMSNNYYNYYCKLIGLP